ncbi:YxiJ family protein [Bacillus bombysepticus]|nr:MULTISPECIES: YxiJ family protein [Bacillus]MDJ0282091.1 YxiJ family protein [Bacillus bombysepticus]MCU5276422.1 YxiJ-like family protein [Bacillus cereus]MCU5667643.1 YxiJ-like family protein [Bacillus cereus]MDJ0293699.1 YxiJ family protein [Bacillus bombysepticus]MDJ0300186.1 YxiJ family protein [Bacillus bombysepticus]
MFNELQNMPSPLYKPFPNCDIRKIRKDFNNTFTEDDCISADLNYYWMHTAGTLSYVLNNNEQEIMNYPILYRDFINYEKTRKLLLYYLTE